MQRKALRLQLVLKNEGSRTGECCVCGRYGYLGFQGKLSAHGAEVTCMSKTPDPTRLYIKPTESGQVTGTGYF